MFAWTSPRAQFFVPSGIPIERALEGITHLAVGAHPDDLEFMAGHAIVECYGNPRAAFLGVTVCSGGESASVQTTRREEQEQAARLGGYRAVLTLGVDSGELKKGQRRDLVKDLHRLFEAVTPSSVYTHNPADKHDTHVAVCLSVVEALRALPSGDRPQRLLGCEVWRGLDWMLDPQKVLLDVSRGEKLLSDLMKVYVSQLKEKAYDEATIGRKRANATYLNAYAGDAMKLCEYAMDLSPLLKDLKLDVKGLVESHLKAFTNDVSERLKRVQGG